MTQIAYTTMLSVCPSAVEKMQRVQFAVDLIHMSTDDRETRKRVRDYFGCSRTTAWRVVGIAKDIA